MRESRKPVDFGVERKRIRKRFLANMKREANQLIRNWKQLGADAAEIPHLIENDGTVSQEEKDKLMAEFVQEQTESSAEGMAEIQRLMEELGRIGPAKIGKFRKKE